MIKSHIYMIEDIISQEDRETLINVIQEKCIYERTFNESTNTTSKAVRVLDFGDHADEIVKRVLNSIANKIHSYGFDIYDCSPPILRKIYGPTNYHVDNVIDRDDEETVPINRLRCLSVVLALNSEYDGGEFCFPQQNKTIKLKAGQAVLFPPYWTHPHYTKRIKNGTFRYTLTTWFYGTCLPPPPEEAFSNLGHF